MSSHSKLETPTSTPTPAPQAPAQWAIDPALQQMPATSTPAGMFYSSYSYYYQQQAQTQRPASSVATTSSTTATAAPKATSGSGGLDISDIATLNDALGSAGVDLRAEEESLQKSHDSQLSYRSYQDRTRTQPQNPSFNTHFLGTAIRNIASDTHKLSKPPSEDAINYLALALRARLQDLIKGMIDASHHRTDTSFDRPASFYDGDTENPTPMWSIVVRRDVSKQLAALEKVEREEELKTRRERKERADMAAAQLAALQASSSGGSISSAFPSADSFGGMDDDSFDNPKKKRKKEGPGVAAKNMSEDVRKQMSNLVANQASGMGKKYAWMTASNANVAPRSKATEAASTKAAGGTASSPVGAAQRSTWSKPYISTNPKGAGNADSRTENEDENATKIILRDAMFVIEKERGHGGGRGAALGWT